MMMRGGVAVPVHTDRPSRCTLIHEDDILATIPGLLRAASVPATIVNWAGQEHVSIEEWCAYLGELTGLKPTFAPTTKAFGSIAIDPTRKHALIGETKVKWRDGMKRMAKALAPDLVRA